MNGVVDLPPRTAAPFDPSAPLHLFLLSHYSAGEAQARAPDLAQFAEVRARAVAAAASTTLRDEHCAALVDAAGMLAHFARLVPAGPPPCPLQYAPAWDDPGRPRGAAKARPRTWGKKREEKKKKKPKTDLKFENSLTLFFLPVDLCCGCACMMMSIMPTIMMIRVHRLAV
jgi:hypothetical protein